jgi:hypothetical protein
MVEQFRRRVGSLVPLALITPLLFGCAHSMRRVPTSAQPALAAPSALSPRSASQVIHAAYGSRVMTMRTAIQLDAAGLKVVGVTATGQRLFTVGWDGKAVTAEKSPLVPDNVDPARVLADVQLALWPLEALQETLRSQALEVSEPFAGVRRLRRGSELLAEVHYTGVDPWASRLWLVNFELDYSLTIDTSTAR